MHGKTCYDTLRLKIVLRTEKHATHERDFTEKMPLNEVCKKSCFCTAFEAELLCFLCEKRTSFCSWQWCWNLLLFLYYTEKENRFTIDVENFVENNYGV